jgi:hypothetical protein
MPGIDTAKIRSQFKLNATSANKLNPRRAKSVTALQCADWRVQGSLGAARKPTIFSTGGELW